jgi:hypothetical protein
VLYAKAQPNNPLFFDPKARDILDRLGTGYRLAYKLAGAFKMTQRAQRIVSYQLDYHRAAESGS